MIKNLTAFLRPSSSSSSAPAAAPAKPSAPQPFTLDAFERSKSGPVKRPPPSGAGELVDAVARSKASQAIEHTAKALAETVGKNSWADHVDTLRTAIGNAAERVKAGLASGELTPRQALDQSAQWERLVGSLVHVAKGARVDDSSDRSTQLRVDAQFFQHHRAIEALDGKADLEGTIRLTTTLAAQVPSGRASSDDLAEFKKRLGLVRELSGHTPARDFMNLSQQFPALSAELSHLLAPPASSATSVRAEPESAPAPSAPSLGSAHAPSIGTGSLPPTLAPSSAPPHGLAAQGAAFQERLAQAFLGPQVTSAEQAASVAASLQRGVVASSSAFRDAWTLAGDASASRAALDRALAAADGVMTTALWNAMPASARDLYRASDVVASFTANGLIGLSKDGFPIEQKSPGGSGEGQLTLFKQPGLNLVVDQHLGGYEQPDGVNIGNRNLAYIFESKLRVGAQLLEFGRFDREVRLDGKPLDVGAGVVLADGSRLERTATGYRVSTGDVDLDVSYYHDANTGVPRRGLVHKNLANVDDVDPSQPQTFLQSFQVRVKNAPVEAEGLLGQVVSDQSLQAPDRAVSQKRDLWRMDLSPWLTSDFTNPR